MKNAFNISLFKSIICSTSLIFSLFALIGVPTESQAQASDSKKITRTFSGKDRVKVKHRYGTLVVKQSPNNEVRLETTFSLSGDSQADVDKALSYFDVKVSESDRTLDVETELQTKNWQTQNERSKLTFEDGTVIRDLRDIEVEFILHIPDLSHLALANRYDDIILENAFEGELLVELYSGKLETKDLRGSFRLDLKYGEAFVGNTHDANLQIYDGELEIGNTRQLDLRSKYSEIEIGSTDNCRMETYEDEVQIGLIKGELLMMDKYSDFEIGNFRSGRMDLYESELEMQSGESLQVKSKYSNFSFNSLRSLSFESSYEDELDIQSLGDLSADMKYSQLEIGQLTGKMALKAYDSELEVDNIGEEFAGLTLDGKYVRAELNLPTALKYRLMANMQYGKLEYDDSNIEPQTYIEKGDNLEVKANVNNATDDSPLVQIQGYDCEIELQ